MVKFARKASVQEGLKAKAAAWSVVLLLLNASEPYGVEALATSKDSCTTKGSIAIQLTVSNLVISSCDANFTSTVRSRTACLPAFRYGLLGE
jgi:hypothetical protein